MAKFRIYARSVDVLHVDIEAENEEQAMEMYQLIDGDSFHQSDGYFEFSEIDELPDDAGVDYREEDLLC